MWSTALMDLKWILLMGPLWWAWSQQFEWLLSTRVKPFSPPSNCLVVLSSSVTCICWRVFVPCCTLNELPRGSIDHHWLLLRRALLWARQHRPGVWPQTPWQAEERWPIRRLKGRPTCLSRTLTLGMDFLQLPPPLLSSRLDVRRQNERDYRPSPRGEISSRIKRRADVSLQRASTWIT